LFDDVAAKSTTEEHCGAALGGNAPTPTHCFHPAAEGNTNTKTKTKTKTKTRTETKPKTKTLDHRGDALGGNAPMPTFCFDPADSGSDARKRPIADAGDESTPVKAPRHAIDPTPREPRSRSGTTPLRRQLDMSTATQTDITAGQQLTPQC